MSTPSTPGAAARGSFDFGRGLAFVTEDPAWIKKLLIGGVLVMFGLLIVPSIFVGGYFIRLLQRTARGEPRPLPEWEDWGGLFNDGLRVAGIYLVYVAVLLAVPLSLGCLLALMGGGLQGLSHSSQSTSEALGAVVGLGLMGLYAILMLVMLLLYLYLPAALTRFALLDRFGAAFEFRANFGFIRRNFSAYALALLLYLVASVASQFGAILCCVGLFPAAFWAICVLAWGMGEVARLDTAFA